MKIAENRYQCASEITNNKNTLNLIILSFNNLQAFLLCELSFDEGGVFESFGRM